MIHTYSLHTSQIDVLEAALFDIQEGLQGISLSKYSVGIIACHYDYINNGIVSAIAKMLPFPLIGFTTYYQATPNDNGLFSLTITVLTSPDVVFKVTCSDTTDYPDTLSPEARIASVYKDSIAGFSAPPAFIMPFVSPKRPISGDIFLELFDELSGGVPQFGAVTTGEDEVGTNVFVICGDKVFTNGFALLSFYGEAHVKFYYGNHQPENLLMMRASVTKASGAVVHELNNKPATDYLQRHGIEISEDTKMLLPTIPFCFKKTPQDPLIARTMVDFLPDKSAVFLGDIPEGSIFRIGTANTEDILAVSRSVMEEAVKDISENACFFIFSCVGRYIALGLDITAELDLASALIPKENTYLSSYVGGEFCPVIKDGTCENYFHNSSFIVCVIE
ncbi:MAG: FIST N-terminal domain-containing protein [Christensenellaceae bacterium]